MTKICYLIGYPVEHSLSPVMHNSAFQKLGLDYSYEAIPVEPQCLRAFVEETLRKPKVRGANVTIPHKVEVIKFLDEVDSLAVEIGAVNTIVNDKGVLKGFNTDGIGALRALKEVYGPLEGKKIVLLGSGGAARAIGYYLVREVKAMVILNRTESKALALANDLKRSIFRFPVEILGAGLSEARLIKELRDTDVVINTTPVGMYPNVKNSPIHKSHLNNKMMVFDIVYNPLRTKLIIEATNVGAKTLNGLSMFVYQGAEAFKLWTSRDAPIDLMIQVVSEALEGDR